MHRATATSASNHEEEGNAFSLGILVMYGLQAALIAECFTGRLRYSGASIGYQLASVFAGGPAPLIATALFAGFKSGYAIALYILARAVISFAAAALLPDYTNRDISQEYDRV